MLVWKWTLHIICAWLIYNSTLFGLATCFTRSCSGEEHSVLWTRGWIPSAEGEACNIFLILLKSRHWNLLIARLKKHTVLHVSVFYGAALVNPSSLTKLSLEFYVMEMIAITSFIIIYSKTHLHSLFLVTFTFTVLLLGSIHSTETIDI